LAGVNIYLRVACILHATEGFIAKLCARPFGGAPHSICTVENVSLRVENE